jgi:hypothetical protein
MLWFSGRCLNPIVGGPQRWRARKTTCTVSAMRNTNEIAVLAVIMLVVAVQECITLFLLVPALDSSPWLHWLFSLGI